MTNHCYSSQSVIIRSVSMHVSRECHTHQIGCHISKIADLAGLLNEGVSSDERGVSSP
jgi:hypothetical protein